MERSWFCTSIVKPKRSFWILGSEEIYLLFFFLEKNKEIVSANWSMWELFFFYLHFHRLCTFVSFDEFSFGVANGNTFGVSSHWYSCRFHFVSLTVFFYSVWVNDLIIGKVSGSLSSLFVNFVGPTVFGYGAFCKFKRIHVKYCGDMWN